MDWLTSDDDDFDPDSSLQDCSAVSCSQLLPTFRTIVTKQTQASCKTPHTRWSASYLRRLDLQQRRCDKLKSRHFNLLGCYRNMTATDRVLRHNSSQAHLAVRFCLICAACLSIQYGLTWPTRDSGRRCRRHTTVASHKTTPQRLVSSLLRLSKVLSSCCTAQAGRSVVRDSLFTATFHIRRPSTQSAYRG